MSKIDNIIGTIWLNSDDLQLSKCAAKVLGGSYAVEKIDTKNHSGLPQLMLCCDYHCDFVRCSKQLSIPARFPNISFGIARPVLRMERIATQDEFIISHFMPIGTNEHQNTAPKTSEPLRYANSSFEHLVCSHSLSIGIQQEVIDLNGKNPKISRMAREHNVSYSHLSSTFKKETGISLGYFASLIRFCHALCDLLISHKSIKSIALDFGYAPEAFSLAFFRRFNIWPKAARRIFQY